MPSLASTVHRAHAAYVTSITYAKAHKLITLVAVIVILGGGYWAYAKTAASTVETKYVLGTAQKGTVIATVSGSGQVSPSDQVDIKPKVSGDVVSVPVTAGQTVKAGTVIAYLDSTDAQNTVRNAKADLENAQISYQKTIKPADQLTLTQSQNAVTKAQESLQTAQTNLSKDYVNAYNDIVATYLDMPTLMTSFKDIVTGTGASHGTQWNIDYYKTTVVNWDNSAYTYRDSTYSAFQKAQADYSSSIDDYKKVTQSSNTSTIASLLDESYTTAQSVTDALNTTNAFIQFYSDQVKDHNQQTSSTADSSLTDLNTYISKMNNHLSALLSDRNALQSDQQAVASAKRSIVENQLSLEKLQAGADSLDIQSSQLSIQQKQNSLQQAQDDLANYTVRAPFDGVIASINVKRGDSASSGTAVATLISKNQIAEMSLNEVDAAKVSAGQNATLTFDAIDGLTIAGKVASVDTLGTVSSGVVSYTVKIAFDTQDSRVKPGMTTNATIQTDVHQDTLYVPSSAVKTQSGKSYVLVFDPALETSGTAAVTSAAAPKSVSVVTGISDDTNTEITSGLTEGQQIVVKTTTGSASSATSKTTTTSSSKSSDRGGMGGPGMMF